MDLTTTATIFGMAVTGLVAAAPIIFDIADERGADAAVAPTTTTTALAA